jgi:hypothetical protein
MRVCGYAGMRVCVHAGMRVSGYACMLVCLYACLRKCVYACMRVCVWHLHSTHWYIFIHGEYASTCTWTMETRSVHIEQASLAHFPSSARVGSAGSCRVQYGNHKKKNTIAARSENRAEAAAFLLYLLSYHYVHCSAKTLDKQNGQKRTREAPLLHAFHTPSVCPVHSY